MLLFILWFNFYLLVNCYKFSIYSYEAQTLLLNGVSVSIRVSDTDTRMTLVGHVSVKCLIKKIFVEFLTILIQF